MLNVLDLFSGIGGFSLGLERTGGFETVAFCEIEPFPRKVLAKHWPKVPIYEDIRKLTGEQVGPVGLICGGYPCQPDSLAGKRLGKKDDRYLWPEFARLVAELRPTWVIGENVAGHISMGLDGVLTDLEVLGYATRTFVIPALAVGAKHKRDRTWVVANCKSNQSNVRKNDEYTEKREVQETVGGGRSIPPNSHGVRLQRPWGAIQSLHHTSKTNRQEHRTLDDSGWPVEPNMGRMANGVPNGVDRLKGLGNAVVPQITELIGIAILKAIK